MMMTKEDGSICQTAEENAKVFHKHFENLYNRNPDFDAEIIDLLDQLPTVDSAGHVPEHVEIRKAILHLNNKAPGDSGITPQMFKSILEDATCFEYFCDIVMDIWTNETCPTEWDIGKLVIIPKKGDLSKPGNYRGIMLLEAPYKIFTVLIHNRLQPIVEQLDHES